VTVFRGDGEEHPTRAEIMGAVIVVGSVFGAAAILVRLAVMAIFAR